LLFTFYEPLGFEAPWLRFWSLSVYLSVHVLLLCSYYACSILSIVEEGFRVQVTQFCLWWIVNYCWCPAWWEPVSANAQVWLLLNRVPLECEVYIRADTRRHQPWLAELWSWCGACRFSRPPGWCQWIWSPRTQVFIHSINAYGDVPTTHPPASKRKKNSSSLVSLSSSMSAFHFVVLHLDEKVLACQRFSKSD
jgi:hypothetical protein